MVAAVAFAVLVVGGGGAYLAASATGGGGGAVAGGHGTPPPLALDGYTTGATSGTSGIAPGEPDPYGVTYRATGALPSGPGSAPVYRAQGQVSAAEVARLAKALGVAGTPVAEGQVWKVGSGGDGSGPSLQVNRQAPGLWTFTRYAPGTDDCKGGAATCTHDPAAPSVDPVSEAAAKKAAAPVLKAVGQDDAKVDASRTTGAQRTVNADPVIDGLPTYGLTTGLTVSAQGEITYGSGELKAPVKGDTYPTLSAAKTLALMNTAPKSDHRMGIGGCASPEPLKDRLEAPCGSGSSAGTGAGSTGATDGSATDGSATVEKAVFGLAVRSSGGRQALVPSWLYEVRLPGAQDTTTVTYPAVDPTYLTSSSPSASASPEPSGTGSTKDVKVDSWSADGTTLTVRFTGGVCADYKTSASETSGTVTVKVTETPWKGRVCVMIAKFYEQQVRLDRPVGDRKVVGTDGATVPRTTSSTPLPKTSAQRVEPSSLAR
ncbi:hypothetical protein [Streptomyces mangrovisoli]|uniref:hypothetical protein n=1 Tax=Streptomyces mangrovisoli TaxID=1428628 RepID=UPI003B846CA2